MGGNLLIHMRGIKVVNKQVLRRKHDHNVMPSKMGYDQRTYSKLPEEMKSGIPWYHMRVYRPAPSSVPTPSLSLSELSGSV
jgi:hypothetical protein